MLLRCSRALVSRIPEHMNTDHACIAYYIAFGAHGPRALPPPGENTKVFIYTLVGVLAAGALFVGTRSFARGSPRTMTKEWQEASNEYFKVRFVIARRREKRASRHFCSQPI